MDGSNHTGKKKGIIALAVLLFLLAPLMCSFFAGTHGRPLNGAFYHEKDLYLNWKDWFRRIYQDQKEKYLGHHFAWHNYYVRGINQLDFWLFKKAHARHVVVGENNFLYEADYIRAYYGLDFIGEKNIEAHLRKFKAVQDTLAKLNKLTLLVLAPGKASFYPEHIPDRLKTDVSTSNYKVFAQKSKELNVNLIDFNQYYLDQKYKSKYPLYPQFGIHWSLYGSIKAFDSIVRYIETKTGEYLADIRISDVRFSDSLVSPDDDIVKGMNLLWEPKTFRMAYPRYSVKCDWSYPEYKNGKSIKRCKKLKVLVVADSFWWSIYDARVTDKIFSSLRFWYYNEEMYPETFQIPYFVSYGDYFSRIREADVIMIMQTESTLQKFGLNFMDMCYETYIKPNPEKEKLQRKKASMSSTPEWLRQITEKARLYNIPIDSMLTIDAKYMISQEK